VGVGGARVAGGGQEVGKAGPGIRPTALPPEQTQVSWGRLILHGLAPSLHLLGRRKRRLTKTAEGAMEQKGRGRRRSGSGCQTRGARARWHCRCC
jgi:hypothetical protein